MNPRISKWFHEFLSGVFTKSTASPSRVSCLRFVRESHLNDLKPSRLYIQKNEDNRFPGMKNKFLGVLSPFLSYYHA